MVVFLSVERKVLARILLHLSHPRRRERGYKCVCVCVCVCVCGWVGGWLYQILSFCKTVYPCSHSFPNHQKVTLVIPTILNSAADLFCTGDEHDEADDLETLLRQEREREKARRQEDMDNEVS